MMFNVGSTGKSVHLSLLYCTLTHSVAQEVWWFDSLTLQFTCCLTLGKILILYCVSVSEWLLLNGQDVANHRQSRVGHAERGSVI